MNGAEGVPKTALVTGGTRGIGRAVALRLAHMGSVVILNYLQNDAAAEEAQRLVADAGGQGHLVRANLAFPSEIDALFEKVRAIVDHLDLFVHCAALGAFKPLFKIKPNQWDLSLAVNTRAFLQCVQNCLPLMPQGRIIAVSSLGSRRAVPNYGAIGASKAALEAVIRQLAVELAPRGIQINGVCGGFVDTEATRLFPDYDTLVADVIRRTPAGRLGRPEDIADAVMLLIAPESGWIQGQIITADGGLSLT